ncbi:MAG: hypothetical protein K6A65_08585 [Succinivibrionaceae bacterium]|nr:hypothetical protein [Succinivibrionaceae bacterium]
MGKKGKVPGPYWRERVEMVVPFLGTWLVSRYSLALAILGALAVAIPTALTKAPPLLVAAALLALQAIATIAHSLLALAYGESRQRFFELVPGARDQGDPGFAAMAGAIARRQFWRGLVLIAIAAWLLLKGAPLALSLLAVGACGANIALGAGHALFLRMMLARAQAILKEAKARLGSGRPPQ